MGVRESLLTSRSKLRVEDVTELAAGLLPEGGRLYLRELTAAGRDAYEAHRLRQTFDDRGRSRVELHLRGVRGLLLALTLCDAGGCLLFEESDAEALGEMPAVAADRLFERAAALSGLDRQAEEALAKNSSRAGGAGSPSPSPSPAGNGTLTASSP